MREISIPIVRPMRPEDPERIAAAERAQGWAGAASDKYFTRLRDAAEGRCAALVAELDGEPVGRSPARAGCAQRPHRLRRGQ